MAGATVSAIVGRTCIGWLMQPSADRRPIASASYGVQIIGSLLLLATGGENAAVMVFGVLLFGLGIGNAASLPPLIAQVEFDETDVSCVVPLIVALSQATYALARALFGIARTVYDPVVSIVAVAIQLLAVTAFLYGRSPRLDILISRQANDPGSIQGLLNRTGRAIVPSRVFERPHPQFLRWHRENCFKQ